MIASPGDVSAERAIVRDVIYEWNAVNSNTRKSVLLPIGWESHSSPAMGAPAQTIINEQVLEHCDLLVGVFWTRVGTATEQYASGTVEEIEKHISSGKPAMLYFSSQPVAIDTVDMDQINRLRQFKDSCQKRGLYESYDSHVDFKAKFYRQLQLTINRHPLFLQPEQEINRLENIVESKMEIPDLTTEARILLKEASADPHGVIIHARFIGGTAIQTNGKNLIPSESHRVVATWESALNELIEKGLVIARGHKGEIFEVSASGYQTADIIAL